MTWGRKRQTKEVPATGEKQVYLYSVSSKPRGNIRPFRVTNTGWVHRVINGSHRSICFSDTPYSNGGILFGLVEVGNPLLKLSGYEDRFVGGIQ